MKGLKNGEIWYDNKGKVIHAHGGCLLYHNGYYYWYGENRVDNAYVNCYRSTDLKEWEFRNTILHTNSKCEKNRVKAEMCLTNENSTKCNIERPKVVYNEKTGKFVMWAHYENGKGYKCACICVASCDTPDGNFTYHGSFNPFGNDSRDCTIFKDDNNKAYLSSSSRGNADLKIYSLQDDYLNVSREINTIWQGEYREAPAIFKRNGIYYMITSYCTGWSPNQAKYGTATSLEGEWSTLTEIADETTYQSQSAFIINQNNDFYYFGDRWDGDDYFNSRYVCFKLDFDGEKMIMNYCDEVNL